MPRRRPGAVRAERWQPSRHVTVRRIGGVSALTRAAVRRVEAEHLWPGAAANALATYESVLRLPGQDLAAWLIDVNCPCCCALEARDTLEDALYRLPTGARTDLRRRLARADEELARRTLPEPWRRETPQWQPPGAWWRQRLLER
ncbi:hypothetical protein ACIBMX_43015 [Streptomyces phaeochromogenes]|uniref:hypothetical protein n=1 Tax=Streptomyces phaeochromogenes TaxID=1923 RepID=UPI0033E06566